MAMIPGTTYHDVAVIIDGRTYRIADNYAYHLTCTRTSGWQLWYVWAGEEQLVGGEYNFNQEFKVLINNTVVFDCTPKTESP